MELGRATGPTAAARSDLPPLPAAVPRALTPSADPDLMTAVGQLDDPAGRCAITILRGTGLRLGEPLDLEPDYVIDYRDHGTWLRVPFGKLNTERTVPLDQPSLDAFDNWANHRGHSRPSSTPARADQSGSWRLFSRVGRGSLGTLTWTPVWLSVSGRAVV